MAGIIQEYEEVFDDCRQAGFGAMLFDNVYEGIGGMELNDPMPELEEKEEETYIKRSIYGFLSIWKMTFRRLTCMSRA